MITINDDDLPITVAQKIITATRDCDNTVGAKLNKILGGDGKRDMFSDEEIYEISLYLGIYAKRQLELEVEQCK